MKKFMKDQLSPPKFDGIYRLMVGSMCYEYHTKGQAERQFKSWLAATKEELRLYSWIYDSDKWLLIDKRKLKDG